MTNFTASSNNAPLPAAKATPRCRRDAVVYWGSTALVCLALLFGIVNFTFNDHFPEWDPHGPPGFAHLGLPPWFKVELIVAKVLALPALLLPRAPAKIRDLAYAGFGLTLVSAVIAHAASGDARVSVLFIVQPLIVLGALLLSFTYRARLPENRKTNAELVQRGS